LKDYFYSHSDGENICGTKNNKERKNQRREGRTLSSGADAIKKFTPSLGIPYLGV